MRNSGSFRDDLFQRLACIILKLPPLRERTEDIPALIDYFSERYCSLNGYPLKIFEPLARECLIEYDWPGNIRQLMDTVQSLIDLTPSQLITRKEVLAFLSQEEDL